MIPAVALAFGMTAMIACSGGGGGGSGEPEDVRSARSLAPVTRALTGAERQHLLVRTQFAVDPDQEQELNRVGLEAYVDRMLQFDVDTAVERGADKEFHDFDNPKDYELVRWWMRLMTRTEQPFQEVLAFFWHDHFATSQSVLEPGGKHLFRQHVQLLRRQGNGNLRDLLHAILVDPAMQVWLDGTNNTKAAPNENLAREWFELFSLGVDNGYTQDDIVEAARALTGYRIVQDGKTRRQFVVFDESEHDPDEKTIFGQVGRWQAADVVDLTLAHRGVAEYIGRRLFEYFCYDGAPADVVQQLGAILRQNGYDLRPLLRTILRSEAFFSAAARKGRIKSPIEYVVGFVRATGLEIPFANLQERMDSLGQQPTQPPGVDGWPHEQGWLSPQAMLETGNAINEVISSRDYQLNLGLGLAGILPPVEERSAERVVDDLARRLRIQPTTAERNLYVDYLNTRAFEQNGESKKEPDAFDGSDPAHVNERVRGLLFVLSQHPDFYLR